MPEISNTEMYKLRSKLEEIKEVVKRFEDQLESIEKTPNLLDDDTVDFLTHNPREV